MSNEEPTKMELGNPLLKPSFVFSSHTSIGGLIQMLEAGPRTSMCKSLNKSKCIVKLFIRPNQC